MPKRRESFEKRDLNRFFRENVEKYFKKNPNQFLREIKVESEFAGLTTQKVVFLQFGVPRSNPRAAKDKNYVKSQRTCVRMPKKVKRKSNFGRKSSDAKRKELSR